MVPPSGDRRFKQADGACIGVDLGPATDRQAELVVDMTEHGARIGRNAERLEMLAQHVAETVRPALERGAWVVSDRFTDSSYAYQGGGRGLDPAFIAELERRVVGLQPGLTLLFDLGVDEGRARVRGRDLFDAGAPDSGPDRIEREHDAFFERVRAAFLARVAVPA